MGFRLALYANGFLLGLVLMSFEMLGSRYLNPWFGSGIYTWAALISVTLFALMAGYFAGGALVDRYPRADVLGWLVVAASGFMALIPATIEPAILWVIDWLGDGPVGVIGATVALLLVPLTLIACYSPFAVRLLLTATNASGRQTGAVYGISTVGNIIGTLLTAFWLIPNFGSRSITYMLAVTTAVLGLWLILLGRRR